MSKLIAQWVLVVSFMLVAGCQDQVAPTLRLGTNVWPGYEPLYLAREKGYLKSERVHLVEYSNNSQVIQAYRNELIDAAALTLDEVLLLLAHGERPQIVLVLDISNGGDAVIGKPSIATLADVKGKRVGVEGNALGAYMLTRTLEMAGLDRAAINVIQMGVDEHEQAFLQDKIDVVVTFDPVRSKLLAAGGNLLFDSSRLPGEIVDVLIVRREFAAKSPGSVGYLVDAWYQALAMIKSQPREAAAILGKRMKLDVDATLAAYGGITLPGRLENQRLLQGRPEPTLQISARKMEKLMFEQGLVGKEVDVSVLFSGI